MYEEGTFLKVFSNCLSWKNLDTQILEHPLMSMPVRYVLHNSYHILTVTRNDWSVAPVYSG